MTFEEELKNLEGKTTIEEVSAYKIGLYLQKRAKEDTSVARNIEKEKKNLSECYKYVKKEVGKMVQKDPVVMMSDEPVYKMAVHYYDEDNIKTVEEKEPVEKSSVAPVQQEKIKPVHTHKKKNDALEGQMTLF